MKKWTITPVDQGLGEEHESLTPSRDCETKEDNPLDAIDTTGEELVSPVVRLIQAARLPSRHVKFVRARVLDPLAKGAAVFEPEKEA